MKVLGFTIMEVLITMVLLLIFIGMGLQISNIVRFNFNYLEESNSDLLTLQKKDMELNTEFFNAAQIKLMTNPVRVIFGQEKEFLLGEEIVIASSDSILFDSIFNGKIIYIKNEIGNKLVTTLLFDISNKGTTYPLSYSKSYDVATRLNYNKLDSISF